MGYSNGNGMNGNGSSGNSLNGNGSVPSLDGHAEANLRDYLSVMYRSRWSILAIFIAVVSVTLYVTLTTPPTFEAAATIIVDERQGMGQSLFDFTAISQQRTLINNQVEILKSRSLAQEVMKRLLSSMHKDSLAILHDLERDKTQAEFIEEWRERVTISPLRDTDLINIQVRAATPFAAAFLANSFVEAYRDLDVSLSRGEISQVVDFLNEQLRLKEQDLRESEELLKNFLRTEKIASLTDEATQVVEQSAEFESLYKEALIDFEVTQQRLDYLKGRLGKSKETLEAEIAKVSSPLVFQLREEMAEIERNMAIFLAQGVGDRDPQVDRERQKLSAIKGRMTEEIQKLVVGGLPPDDPLAKAQALVAEILAAEIEATAFRARATALERVVNGYAMQLEGLPEKNVRLARLERNRKVDENLYMMMREKHEESRITQAGQIGKVRVLDPAVEPAKPISPRKKLNVLLGAVLGLGLGLGLALLREHLDTSIRKIEDIEAQGLTVLAAIPRMDFAELDGMAVDPAHNSFAARPDSEAGRLVTQFRPKSPASEAYRTLRTNLQYAETVQDLRSFLVTSSGPEEGKSTTISNLAIAVALQGKKTILIDADLRRPVVHRTFRIRKGRGLTNVLVGSSTIDEVIQPSGTKNLDILPGGVLPPNPSELLGSPRMRDLVEQLEMRYDLCLFDSPPLLAVTDAAVLSKQLDGVLLVVKSGQTQHDALARAKELLRNVGARMLGCVLNDVSRENAYGSYQYYYYYGEGERKKKRHGSRNVFKGRQHLKAGSA